MNADQVKSLRILADTPLSAAAEKLLKQGVAPAEVVYPGKAAASVLAGGDPEPLLATADISFGQPDVAGILESKRLRWVQLTSAGYTRYDTTEFRAAARSRGLVLTNSSAVYADACAEHVFAFMLAQSRCLPDALQSHAASGTPEWDRFRNSCKSLREQKAVILGFGAIASRLVELLRPFSMQITALRRSPRGNEGIPVVTQSQLPASLADADHVINILSANAETIRFVSSGLLAKIKPGAVFYNIGRGTTVDQSALADALRSGRLRTAWLDVTDPEPLPEDHPLRSIPNCFITPHIAGGHHNESETLVRHFLDNFRLYLDGKPLVDRVM